jgi:hypothetical protein
MPYKAWRFCFKDLDGKIVCVRNFRIDDPPVVPWPPIPPRPPEPDPRASPGDPSPWRFFEHETIRPEIIEDLAKLAALDALAGSLSSERAKPIQAAIRAAVPRDLPNLEISF